MTRLRVESFTISLDGYGAGPDQGADTPLGIGGTALHHWAMKTQTFRHHVFGQEGGSTDLDDEFARRGFENIGATIMGRNMFGPVRGPWPDHKWRGWWGNNPPYHTPVYVLTNHSRPSLEMEGGTVFHFVTEGPEAALEQAKQVAGGKDIRVGGGAETIRQFLEAGLMDEMHIVVSPVLLGSGEPLFQGLDLPKLGYRVAQQVLGENATHFVIDRAD